ncbi:CACTA en-spm transposon protein [Cucumis melo var. makuwa]|uniref:CACTA en-spm transposon protein n=1 Tax=Cucumis melo var. makuwa TaxID=1194695 RepID=A0A5A7SII7_CUCMM|nr:CACTA en-spm transposon protein [Cucumis melo var. makuwa]
MRREKGNSRRALNPFSRRLTRRREKPLFPTPLPTHCSRRREKPLFPIYFLPTPSCCVGKKGFPDAAPDALFTASGKTPFPDVFLPTPSWCVGKGCFPDASPDALLRASGKPLFPTFFMPTCFSASGILHFLENLKVKLMHVKVLNGWSNKSFDMLELLRATFAMSSSTIPNSFYEVKRKLRCLGLGFETIHASKYDCVLYWKEFTDLQHCPTCGKARYKVNHNKEKRSSIRDKSVEIDDVFRHPADVKGWKHFDCEFSNFASDLRNVRLGLASDEFDPFGHMSISYRWTTKGYQACPICMSDRLLFEIRGRISFMGHRCYLLENHMWRRSRLLKVERRPPLTVINEHEILEQLDQLEFSVMSKHRSVCNKVCPEGSIVEAYVMNESCTFCSLYLSGIETRFTRDEKDDDTILEVEEEKCLFYRYILNNVDEILKYRKHYVVLSDFDETNVMFLEFIDDLNNPTRGSSLVGDNSGTTQPYPTPRRRAQSQLLELEYYVHANGWISMWIAPSAEKSISSHAVRFNQAIGVCIRKTVPVRCFRWADVGREYIEVVKGDLQCFFVFDFNDQAMNRFVEHQMLSTFKEFRGDCYKHFKKSNHGPIQLLDRSSLTIIAAGRKCLYNNSTSLLNKENQMLELKSQPTPDGFQPLYRDEICETMLGRRSGYLKGLGWGPSLSFARRLVR